MPETSTAKISLDICGGNITKAWEPGANLSEGFKDVYSTTENKEEQFC